MKNPSARIFKTVAECAPATDTFGLDGSSLFANGNPDMDSDLGRFMDDFWVFGYGSLMWNPGFPFEDHRQATIFGYRRSLCVRSWVHRGTRQTPGLVLGLDRGGACKGMAFRVSNENRDTVMAYLRERELVTHVYLERTRPIRLEDGQRVMALTYVIDRGHEQYAGNLSESQSAAIVLSASGRSGSNPDYVMNTVAHLRQMKIHDHRMETIVQLMERQK